VTVAHFEINGQFRSAMASDRIETDDPIIADGCLHKFSTRDDSTHKKSGWYLLHPDGWPAGAYGDFRLGIHKKWRWNGQGVKLDAAARRRIAEEAKKREEEEAHEHERARLKAGDIWSRLKPAPENHPYLLAKKVRPHGIRVTYDHHKLVVPVCEVDGSIQSLQFIWLDIEEGFVKKFLRSALVSGGFHLIGKWGAKVFIAEGYATAATVHEATDTAVACVFNCYNLKSVAQALRKKYPKIELVICADDDHARKGNPGLTHANEAAKAVNAKVVVPKFTKEHGTDWNDLWCSEGPDAVRKQLAPKPQQESDVPDFPSMILEGSYIGELALALTTGTALASQLAYANIKACLGPVVDRRVGFPGHEEIHLRHYAVNVTFRPRQGKGETWKRVKSTLADLLEERGIQGENGSRFGSGQFMISVLAELEEAASTGQVDVLVRFDEMKELFEKANILASTLISVFCTLFEEHSIMQGSFAHGDHAVYDTHLSVIGDFTHDSFAQSFAGRGATGQGFPPRCTLTYAKWQPVGGDWLPRNIENEQGIVTRMRQAIERLPADHVFLPQEEPDARQVRLAFFAELEKEAEENYFPLELQSHFKRDLLLRTVFSDEQVITLKQTQRSIAWAKHQLNVRRTLWPEDIGSPTEQMERKIIRCLKERGPMSDNDLMNACNVYHAGSGGVDVYNRAMRALKLPRVIIAVGQTRKKRPIWDTSPSD
jgi:phage/plasmid primase-like uncharacterized protein